MDTETADKIKKKERPHCVDCEHYKGKKGRCCRNGMTCTDLVSGKQVPAENFSANDQRYIDEIEFFSEDDEAYRKEFLADACGLEGRHFQRKQKQKQKQKEK